MDFIELAKNRYSSRKYKPIPVEKEKLSQVIEAGRIAPSAVNRQPWHFFVVTQNEMRKKIMACYQRDWIQSAPAIIVVCGDHSKSWTRDDGKDHCDIDIAITTDHLTLAATNLGLATCWVCKFDAKKCSRILQLDDNIEPMVLLPIGYPADSVDLQRHSTKRKPLDEITDWIE